MSSQSSNTQESIDVIIAIPSDIRTITDFERWLYNEVVMADDPIFNDEFWAIFTSEGLLVRHGRIPGPIPRHFMTHEECDLARGNILVHNHPSNFPFSPRDISMAADLNLLESRVVTRKWLYSMRPNSSNGRWPSLSEIKRVEDEITADISLPFPVTHNDSNPECVHRRYAILAERAGFDYSRESIAL